MKSELEALSLAQAAELLCTRKVSPVELTQALIERIGEFDSQLSAFITPTPELALEQARIAESEIARGAYRGPLHGIPVGFKDIYNTAGIRTTAGSRILAKNVPLQDATAVRLLKSAGAITLGKLATHEFAIGGPSHDLPWPVPRNPWNLEHFVGGSSSGSAAAVAAGFVLGALGSDTGASIRNPAALAGIAGLKPTYGLVSRHGVIPNSPTFDHCGPMAWTVEDCAILLQAIAGYDANDPASVRTRLPDFRAGLGAGLHGLRIGVVRHFWEEDLPAAPEMREAMDKAIEVLSALGASMEVVRMRPLRDYHDVRMVIAQTEIFSNHQKDMIDRPGEFGVELIRKVLPACLFTGTDYVNAQRERAVMLRDMAAIYKRFDVLLTAGAGPAPRLDQIDNLDFWRKPSIYNPFNITAGPALAVCIGFSASGMPLGMQIAAEPFRDDAVLRVGHAYESVTSWRKMRPVIRKGARPGQVKPASTPAPLKGDNAMQQHLDSLAQRAGLTLGPRERSILMEVAPHAMAMASRIPVQGARENEPASVFNHPGSTLESPIPRQTPQANELS